LTNALSLFQVINRQADTSDSFSDSEGYYRIILGELLDDGRYHVHANLGRGMFSSVVRAQDVKEGKGREVAIKVIRNQESMYVTVFMFV
jgi:serine/threonine-protein kinase PRP4